MTVRGEDDLARLATSFNAMADSLQRQITQLEGLSQLQQRFTSDVSHELRTPLTTVQMAADVLHEARGDFPPARRPVRRAAARRAGPVRVAAHRPAGDQPLRRRGGRPRRRADRPRRARRPRRRRHVRRSPSCTGANWSSTGPTRRSSPRSTRRVERILRNLVGNAIEHGARRPVEITLAANQTAAAVTVRDSGVGLSPGEAQHVFDRFWRADPSRVRTVGGTGLGLVDQPRGRPPARRVAAGVGPARRRRPVPPHPAAHRRRRPDQLAAAAAAGLPAPRPGTPS